MQANLAHHNITSIIWVYRATSFRHTGLTTSANREEVWSVCRISPNSGNSVERSAWLERKKHKKVHYREHLFTASGAVSIYHLSAGVSASEGPRTARLYKWNRLTTVVVRENHPGSHTAHSVRLRALRNTQTKKVISLHGIFTFVLPFALHQSFVRMKKGSLQRRPEEARKWKSDLKSCLPRLTAPPLGAASEALASVASDLLFYCFWSCRSLYWLEFQTLFFLIFQSRVGSSN